MSRLAQSSQQPTGGHSGEGLNVDVEGGNNHSDDAASESPSLPDQNPYHDNVDTGEIKRPPFPHTHKKNLHRLILNAYHVCISQYD